MGTVSIRPATPDDAASLLAIYRPVVLNTATSFELEPPSVAEFGTRIERSLAEWAWLVAEDAGQPVAYAYATPHRSRGAYKWSVETSVYVAETHRRQGLGTILYAALMPVLVEQGYCNAYAGITLPNAASGALHQRAGFQPVGVFRSVGRKFGAWHDVSWWQLHLRSMPPHE
jgi:phosphinothricin acetyltransferase